MGGVGPTLREVPMTISRSAAAQSPCSRCGEKQQDRMVDRHLVGSPRVVGTHLDEGVVPRGEPLAKEGYVGLYNLATDVAVRNAYCVERV